jgi:hypothetical protein
MLYLDLRGIMFLKIPVWLGHELFGRCRPDGLNAKHPQQYGRYNKQARLYFGRCNGNYHPPRTVIRSSTSEQIGCCRKRFTGIVACLQPVCPKQLVHFTFHTRSTTMRGDRYPIFRGISLSDTTTVTFSCQLVTASMKDFAEDLQAD